MKMRHILIILFAILLFLSKNFSANADELSISADTGELSGELSVSANAMAMQEIPSTEDITAADETSLSSSGETSLPFSDETSPSFSDETSPSSSDEMSLPLLDEISLSGPEPGTMEESGVPAPDEAPLFHAAVEYYSHGYYIVKGTVAEFLPDTASVHPMYSLDGENWQLCGQDWNLDLQTQICLYNNEEPLKSYLNGELDSFYLKLHITRENGETYETQPAVIERGVPQPVPKEISLIANFTSAMRVRETKPASVYGRYQITINADAAPEDVSAFLPDTLPVTIGLYQGIDFITEGTIDCPITWKPLSFSQLTAGESITIPDAAEEIIIPADTLLSTPMGIFQLNEPLGLNHDMATDEIRLVLNVVSENESPAGALTAENDGLALAFHLKPTGAASIRVYTLSAGDTEWKELPALSLLNMVNAQPSTANSSYALVIHKDWEPYRSYLSAESSGETPAPFLIGLKIEGGVYDGQQLILPWPDTYDLPLNLPLLGGSGGNEGNAGADNKNDSTEEGQRPELPQQPEVKAKEPSSAPAQKSEGSPMVPTQKPEDTAEDSPSVSTQKTEDSSAVSTQRPEDTAESSPSVQTQRPEDRAEGSPSAQTQRPEDNAEEKQQNRSKTSENILAEQPPEPPQNPEDKTDTTAGSNTANDQKTEFTDKEENPAASPAADIKNNASIQENHSANAKTGERGPFLPIAMASASCICIAAAIYKMAARRSRSAETP